jgi:carboxyl-terminal processing protease
MKKIYKILLGTVVIISLSSYVIKSNFFVSEEEKDKVIISMAMGYLENLHYQNLAIDDKFSEDAFELYLKRMDYNKRYYLESDVKELEKYKFEIDDEIKAESLEFYLLANELLNKRRVEVEAFYSEILASPFNFSENEKFEMDHDKRKYAKSKNEMYNIWRKDLKYQTLSRLNRKIIKQDKLLANPDTTIEEKTIAELEVDAREGVKKNMDNYFIRVHKINENDRISLYVNSIVNVYGPHTGYFPPEDKERFDISMSGKLEGIGARLSQPGNEIKVVSIVPGSASALQGELKVDDIITEVAQGSDEFVNVEEMRLDEAIKLIKGPKGTKVRLLVIHKSGTEQVIEIIRDVVIIEETYAKSYILNNKGTKVGYINLPKFYTDFSDPNGRSCSKDIDIELKKLMEENVDGVILDLRNNGGGSLRDVVDMVGLFIDKGPVVQVRGRNNELQVLSDKQEGITYNGPLVVMVNEYSASASEIFAAAIQDYNRGIIIGSNSTFGKGTVQRFYDMDQMLSGQMAEYKPLGAIKLTMQKFYRISGGSTQLKGVTPDIILPDLYSYLETGEKEQEFVMPWDKINPVDFTAWNATWNVSEMKYKTDSDIKDNYFFTSIDQMAEDLEKDKDNSTVDLELSKYQAYQKDLTQQSDDYDSLFVAIDGFDVVGIDSDFESLGGDSTKIKIHNNQIKNLEEDRYVYESARLVKHMLKPSVVKAGMQYEVK